MTCALTRSRTRIHVEGSATPALRLRLDDGKAPFPSTLVVVIHRHLEEAALERAVCDEVRARTPLYLRRKRPRPAYPPRTRLVHRHSVRLLRGESDGTSLASRSGVPSCPVAEPKSIADAHASPRRLNLNMVTKGAWVSAPSEVLDLDGNGLQENRRIYNAVPKTSAGHLCARDL